VRKTYPRPSSEATPQMFPTTVVMYIIPIIKGLTKVKVIVRYKPMDERQRTMVVIILFLLAIVVLITGGVRNLFTCGSSWC
jgi:hypothetical protein